MQTDMKKRLPHGISNYERLIVDNCYYVDRTNFLEKLELIPNPYQFLLRPRKFGKSLFLSMMQYYYGVEYKENFQKLFGEYYIGKNPTPLANSFYVLKFDFSGIATYDKEKLVKSFHGSVYSSLEIWNGTYKLLTDAKMQEIKQEEEPAGILKQFFAKVTDLSEHPILILIDEYDHFTNELLSFDFELFKTSVAQNGFVRKFFEVIKTFTGTGLVARMFATGVTPVTLDSLTSGFNVSKNLSLEPAFNEIMGFTDEEVLTMLEYYEVEDPKRVHFDMRDYYNGSKFAKRVERKLYNSNMVLYFLDSITRTKSYPDGLMDVNIMSDYKKIGNIFLLGDEDVSNKRVQEILSSGEIAAELTIQFSFEREFTPDDLISLLYYNGLLTIKGEDFGSMVFTIPNYVIRELYWKYFAQKLEKESHISINSSELQAAMKQMAVEGRIDLYMSIINNTMKDLSNRDLQNFDEKYVKMLFMAFASLSPIYYKKSEYEANRKYPDLLFLSTPVIPVENQM